MYKPLVKSSKSYEDWLKALGEGKTPDGKTAEVVEVHPENVLELRCLMRRGGVRHNLIASWHAGKAPEIIRSAPDAIPGLVWVDVTLKWQPGSLVVIRNDVLGKTTVYHCRSQ